MEYNKLVRDRIPAIIEAGGEIPVTRILGEDEYRRCLEQKLDEEVAEFHESGSPEELADILEVIFALAEAEGLSREELMSVYRAKHDARGGFSEKIFLISKHKKRPEA